jgi:hypothetical protein
MVRYTQAWPKGSAAGSVACVRADTPRSARDDCERGCDARAVFHGVSRGGVSLPRLAQHGQSMRSKVVGSFAFSMGVSFGLSVLVWQHLQGVELYWVILPLAVLLLLVSRFKEEIHSGTNAGSIRSMAGSASVVTAADRAIVHDTVHRNIARAVVLVAGAGAPAAGTTEGWRRGHAVDAAVLIH